MITALCHGRYVCLFLVLITCTECEDAAYVPWLSVLDITMIPTKTVEPIEMLFGVFPSKELRERLGIDDIALVLQQNRLRWYGHVLRKEDDDWVKKCMECEVEGPRARPKRTWREVVKEDCQAYKLNTEDAMDRSKWRKLIKDVQ